MKLFKRSTRKVTLTPEGATFYEDCHRLLDELRAAEDSLTRRREERVGPAHRHRAHRRSAASTSRRTSPAFIAEHPNLAITLHLSERHGGPQERALRPRDPHRRHEERRPHRRQARAQPPRGVRLARLLQARRQAQDARGPRAPQLPRHQHRGRRRRHVELPGQGQAGRGQGRRATCSATTARCSRAGRSPARASRGAAPGK